MRPFKRGYEIGIGFSITCVEQKKRRFKLQTKGRNSVTLDRQQVIALTVAIITWLHGSRAADWGQKKLALPHPCTALWFVSVHQSMSFWYCSFRCPCLFSI